jgi:hypothetical protein
MDRSISELAGPRPGRCSRSGPGSRPVLTGYGMPRVRSWVRAPSIGALSGEPADAQAWCSKSRALRARRADAPRVSDRDRRAGRAAARTRRRCPVDRPLAAIALRGPRPLCGEQEVTAGDGPLGARVRCRRPSVPRRAQRRRRDRAPAAAGRGPGTPLQACSAPPPINFKFGFRSLKRRPQGLLPGRNSTSGVRQSARGLGRCSPPGPTALRSSPRPVRAGSAGRRRLGRGLLRRIARRRCR